METKMAPTPDANDRNTVTAVSIAQVGDLCSAALAYAACGFAVHPLLPWSKRPATRNGFLDATTDPDIIRRWWGRRPQANIGISCGPSGLVVVDIDDMTVVAAARAKGLPPAPIVSTAKGRHIYYASRPERPLASRVGILPGVDIRAQGGYVVAPPSVHPSGTQYTWSEHYTVWNMELPPAPEWLYDRSPTAPRADIAPLADGAPEGKRNQSLTVVVGHLLARGVEPHLAEALTYAYGQTLCEPPLDDAEIAAVWHSIATRELRKRRGRHDRW